MKFKVLFISFILLSAITYSVDSKCDEGKIGEIRYSVLTPPQFQELYGREWELMMGQSIDKHSDLLHLWGREKLPDARGVYLRSANHGRVAQEGNPHGDVHPVGTYLPDRLKSHIHTDESHAQQPREEQLREAVFLNHTSASHNVASKDPNGIALLEEGTETRPRSVIVNTYIKVKEPERSSAPQLQKLTPEMLRTIMNSPEFKEGVENVVRTMMNRRNQ